MTALALGFGAGFMAGVVAVLWWALVASQAAEQPPPGWSLQVSREDDGRYTEQPL